MMMLIHRECIKCINNQLENFDVFAFTELPIIIRLCFEKQDGQMRRDKRAFQEAANRNFTSLYLL